jgi:VanZ family protein
LSPALSYLHLATLLNRRAALFCVLYLAGILYLSLYPWQFVAYPFARTLAWTPLVSRGLILDAVLNVVFYMPLGAAAFLTLRRIPSALAVAAALGGLVSLSVEWMQLSIPTRVGNLADLLTNTIGALLGAVVALMATSPPVASVLEVFESPGPLIVGLWAIWQGFRFLLPRTWSAIDIVQECIGLLILLLLRFRGMCRIAAPILLAWLAFEELRPFHFHESPQAFGWLPFISWFAGASESYYGVIFGKLFFYTSIVWILRESKMRWLWAVAIPALVLAAGEAAQRYLPGRTPESTDLVLLAAGGFILVCVYDNKD